MPGGRPLVNLRAVGGTQAFVVSPAVPYLAGLRAYRVALALPSRIIHPASVNCLNRTFRVFLLPPVNLSSSEAVSRSCSRSNSMTATDNLGSDSEIKRSRPNFVAR